MSARKQRPSERLTRDRIVAAALDIVGSEGLDALSMRRLGADLGVDPMAVYYHVPNKDALLDAIVEAVMSDIDLSGVDRSEAADGQLLLAATHYLQAMLAHPGALPIVLSRSPRTPASLKPVDVMLGMFMDGGLDARTATVAMNTLAAAVRGYAGMIGPALAGEQDVDIEALQRMMSAEEFPALHAAAAEMPGDPEEAFAEGVRAIVRGFLG